MTQDAFWRNAKYLAQAAGAYALIGVFALLPLEAASDAGGAILRRLGPRLGVSARALKNIKNAFPEKTDAEHREILIGMWDNLGRVIAEYPHLHHIWRTVELHGGDVIKQLRDDGKPGIFFASHIANWEIHAISAKKYGLGLNLVYRKPNNPFVDGLLRYLREPAAIGHIEKGAEGAREIVATLKSGGHIGMLIDQKLNEGVPVPFFGRDAMTAPAIAQFALKFDCPLVPARLERLGGAKFKMTIYPPLNIIRTGEKDADIKKILFEINKMVEDWVRARPEQWLWLHRRWPD